MKISGVVTPVTTAVMISFIQSVRWREPNDQKTMLWF